MNDDARPVLPRGAATGLAAVLLLASLAGCATAGGAGGSTAPAASFAGGKFAPSTPPAAQYGADPARKCASSRIAENVQRDAANLAAQMKKQAPESDGRLCAIAQALLAWDDKQPVPEELNAFLAGYYGIPQNVARVVVTTFETENEEDIIPPVDDAVGKYMPSASRLRYGIATTKLRRGPVDRTMIAQGKSAPTATKLALVMMDATIDLDPLPRRLETTGEATVKGKIATDLQNASVLVSDARGKLEQPPSQKTKEFSAPIACGGATGRIVVEIRGEEQGSQRALADFPVYCGSNPPTSVDLPPAQPAAADPTQQEHAIFDQINKERTAAGLPELTWDDRVEKVARDVSQADADISTKGRGSPLSQQEIKKRLEDAGVPSSTILQNPGESRTAQGAHDRFALSPVHRSNYMSTDATKGGVGVVSFQLQGTPAAVVNELFVREAVPLDLATLRPKMRQAIDKNRASAGAPPLPEDPTLQRVADEYAKELAANGGNISNTRHSQLVSPLYKTFRTVDLLSGPQTDPMQVADERTVLNTKEKLLGIGLAQGDHPSLGKNTLYVALIFGTKKK
ncbi:MAG TPA: CAP domain-containing protein [Myxococcales bacterium]|nr:CAP domain-containing protein [Myxococcales bacterium]